MPRNRRFHPLTACLASLAPCLAAPALAAHPPLQPVDAAHVQVSVGLAPRVASSVDYSNMLAPHFIPPVSLPEVNFAGDAITLTSAGAACGIEDYIDEVRVAVRYDSTWGGSATCDLYVVFFDDVNPGSTTAPIFDNFLGGFYLQDVAPVANSDVIYTVTDLVIQAIRLPVPDNSLGVMVIVSQSGSGGTPILPVAGASVLAAGSTPNAAGGSGPDVGSSLATLWCDTNLDVDIDASEEYTFLSPNLGNLFLELKLTRQCPSCTNPLVPYSYLVVGNASGTPWSWSIESQTGEFVTLEDLNTPGTTLSTLAVTQNFANAINWTAMHANGCLSNQITATATPLSGGNALLTILATAKDPLNLYVGPAGGPTPCLVTSLPACSFNPTIQAVELSGNDCNGNNQDDAIDIASGLSADDDGNAIPDECQCPSDFNHSGFVDFDDFTDFLDAFIVGLDNADFDQSGFVDFDDYDSFVHAFESGC